MIPVNGSDITKEMIALKLREWWWWGQGKWSQWSRENGGNEAEGSGFYK